MTERSPHHPLAESLSALADDQAAELELQRLLKASESDPEVKAVWHRYQLMGAAIRNDLPANLQAGDFAARVSAAMQREGDLQTGRRPRWMQRLGQMAVAASVATVAIMGVQYYDTLAPAPEVTQTAQSQPVRSPAVSLPAGYQPPPLSARTVSAEPGYLQRPAEQQVIFVPLRASHQEATRELVDYLHILFEEHADHAALNSSQGMLPFARVVLTEED